MSLSQQDFYSDRDFASFKRKVKLSYGLDLEAYKRPQMERRLRANMDKCGAKSFLEYFGMIEKDKGMLDDFLDRVTINVSELFRNPEQFEVLRTKVLPELLSRNNTITAWSAGCSCGAEAYTLAILLDELSPGKRHSIHATDIDDRMLARAQKGEYQEHEVRSVSKVRLLKYFERRPDGYVVAPRLKTLINFRKHDLLKEAFRSGIDLILCRNVVIYFTDEAKSVLYERFYQSLRPGGYLFVGGTERINDYADIGYVSRFPFFYEKPRTH